MGKASVPHPVLALVSLVGVTLAVLAAARLPRLAPVLRRLPVPFWCYFLPACLGALGLLPQVSPAYRWTSRWLLPVCLALLLLPVDARGLARLGPRALEAMGWGALGIVGGGVLAYFAVCGRLPDEAWKAVGALAGSWTGGSANLVAVKESLAAAEEVFSPVILVDALFAYAWMALLIAVAPLAPAFDRWTGAREVEFPSENASSGASWPWPGLVAAALGLALLGVAVGDRLGPALSRSLEALVPGIGLRPAAWTVLLVTTGGLLGGGSGRFAAHRARAETLGNGLLFLLLASLGAQASLASLGRAPAYLALGALWLAVHGAVLLAAAHFRKIPLALLATASQACVGGVVSAPMVGAVYRPALAAAGLLLAVLGGALGTYVGLLTALLCRWTGGA